MSAITRRGFLASAGLAATAAAVATGRTPAQAAPSERVRHGVIGTGGQGRNHARTFDGFPDCEVVAVCDVDPERRAQAAGELSGGGKVAQHEDYRRILDDPGIDTVSIATPDHWHAPVALAAILAGKHVYVEKPATHNLREARILAETAAGSNRCVQHGTQSRSGEGIRETMDFLRNGGIGKVRMAKAINHQLRRPIGRAPIADPPPGVNYDLWLGPAPEHPFTANRWHYNWHWFWDYGTGDMGNDGVHQLDIARWGLGAGFPQAVSAMGGQLFYEDDHETPDTQVVTFDYGDAYLMYEMRLWTDYELEGHDNGNVFYGDTGKVEVGRHGCFVEHIGERPRKIGGGADFPGHLRNFLDCVKAGDPSGLHAPMGEAFASVALCHLGNIATRLGRGLRYDADRHDIPGDDEARALLSREYRAGYELPTG